MPPKLKSNAKNNSTKRLYEKHQKSIAITQHFDKHLRY